MGQLQIVSQTSLLLCGIPPLVLCFWGCWFAGWEISTGNLFLVAAPASLVRRQPANAGPCALCLPLVLVRTPSVAETGHVPSCSGLGSVFGGRSHPVTALWDVLLGWVLWTIACSKALGSLWHRHRRACWGEVAVREAFNEDNSFSPSRWLNSEMTAYRERYHSEQNHRQLTGSLSS